MDMKTMMMSMATEDEEEEEEEPITLQELIIKF